MRFLSDDWLAALDDAARDRPRTDDDPLADVELVIEQVVTDGPTWRLIIDRGSLRVERGPSDTGADVRLTTDRRTASSIASGERAALDAFMAGELVLGGNVQTLLEHRPALEALGDLFRAVSSSTTFDQSAPRTRR